MQNDEGSTTMKEDSNEKGRTSRREDQKDGSELAGVRKSNRGVRKEEGYIATGLEVEERPADTAWKKRDDRVARARARTCGREHRRGVSGGVARYGLARLGSAWHGVAEPDRVNRVRSARADERRVTLERRGRDRETAG